MKTAAHKTFLPKEGVKVDSHEQLVLHLLLSPVSLPYGLHPRTALLATGELYVRFPETLRTEKGLFSG